MYPKGLILSTLNIEKSAAKTTMDLQVSYDGMRSVYYEWNDRLKNEIKTRNI